MWCRLLAIGIGLVYYYISKATKTEDNRGLMAWPFWNQNIASDTDSEDAAIKRTIGAFAKKLFVGLQQFESDGEDTEEIDEQMRAQVGNNIWGYEELLESLQNNTVCSFYLTCT